MPPWWLPRGGISLNILIASGAWMYNEAYFRFACVQKRICDFMCAWMRYARVRKTEKPRVPHVQGLVENRNSGMRSTPRHHPIERPIALHSLPARPMRSDSHASLNLKPTHWLKPTYYTCNKGLIKADWPHQNRKIEVEISCFPIFLFHSASGDTTSSGQISLWS